VQKPSDRARRSTLSSGILTSLSIAVVTGLSAAVGVVIARKVGRGAETDGFFAAYGVFLVLVLAASAVRASVLPRLARARPDGVFGAAFASYAIALACVAVPALALGVGANDWAARQLTAGLPSSAREIAAMSLTFLVPAAVAHIYAALCASGLAAHDSYGTAAVGYALGSVLGLALIVWRIDEDGIVACAWGTLLNGVVTLIVPLTALAVRADWGQRARLLLRSSFGELVRASSLAIVLQAFFVISLRFAGSLGTGAITSFTYAYFTAAALVSVTASSLGIVSSVPLTRASLSPARATQHVISMSMVSFAAVAAAAGVFALVGDQIVNAALGSAYAGEAGGEIGHLIVLLSPFMAVSIGVTITFPMIFVARRERFLPGIAIVAIALHSAITWATVQAFELAGAALGITVSTGVVLIALLLVLSPEVLVRGARGLLFGGLVVGALALLAFGLAGVLLSSVVAVVVGTAAFTALLVIARDVGGIRQAWVYLRALD
jgi:hypothetical protein